MRACVCVCVCRQAAKMKAAAMKNGKNGGGRAMCAKCRSVRACVRVCVCSSVWFIGQHNIKNTNIGRHIFTLSSRLPSFREAPPSRHTKGTDKNLYPFNSHITIMMTITQYHDTEPPRHEENNNIHMEKREET